MGDDFTSSATLQANTLAMADIFGPDITPLHIPLTNGIPNGTTPSDHPSFWPFSDPTTFTTSSTGSFWVNPNVSTATDTMDIDDPNFFTTPYTRTHPEFIRQHPPAPSGLMIHMPQSRGPSSAVLHPSHQIALSHANSQPQFHYHPPPPMPRRTGPDVSPRRPKPRAPSSGARHHHAYSTSGPGPSPRKTSSSSNSMPPSPSPGPPPCLHRRSASMQLLRTVSSTSVNDPHHPHSHLSQPPASTSSALRKRKSWTTSRRVSGDEPPSHPTTHTIHCYPRKTDRPSSQRSASNLRSSHNHPHHSDLPPLTTSHPNTKNNNNNNNNSSSNKNNNNTSSTSLPLGASGTPGGFVNFTPQDHHVLMRGVAPSGSSKTKARRDREAAEGNRKIREAMRAAVQAAGGDVSKLRLDEEGVGMGLLSGVENGELQGLEMGGGMEQEGDGSNGEGNGNGKWPWEG